MLDQILRITKLLLAIALLVMVAFIIITVQQVEINNLKDHNKQTMQLLKDSQTSNYNFDKAVTERLQELGK